MTLSPGSELPTLADHVSLHIIGNQGLILDSQKQTLLATNGSDTLLLCCLAEGMAHDAVLDTLSRHLDLNREEAGRRLTIALSLWSDAGLFGRRDDNGTCGSAIERSSDDAWRQAIDDAAQAACSVAVRDDLRDHIRLLDTGFEISFADSDTRYACAGVLSRRAAVQSTADRIRMTVARTGGAYELRVGTRPLGRCALREQVPLLVLSAAGRIAVYRSDAAFALHAGAVRAGSGCALLVGPAGTGKSTLVAGLAASGYDALCDDTVLLTGDALDVRPLRTGVWIKRGAWPVVRSRFDGRSAGPERLRPDGQYVRLLPIETALAESADDDRLPARRIVFPSFDASSQPAVDALCPAEALKGLAAHIYLLGHRLDPAAVERLVAWVSSVPSFRIRYPSLDVAIDQFRGIAR